MAFVFLDEVDQGHAAMFCADGWPQVGSLKTGRLKAREPNSDRPGCFVREAIALHPL